MTDGDEIEVWFNPRCQKCRQARALLDERQAAYRLVHYLDEPPSRRMLERVLGLLGLDDPRGMMRQKDPSYLELGLDGKDRDQLLDAMVSHPQLIERPIVVRGTAAVIARPPEKLLDVL